MVKECNSKKFDFATFDSLALAPIRQFCSGMARPVEFPEKLSSIFNEVLASRDGADINNAEKLLEQVRIILKGEAVYLYKGRAELLWELIKSASASGGKERLELWFEFLELTKGCLLLVPDAALYVVGWKWGLNSELLKRFIAIMKPGSKSRGIGGKKKAWPEESNAEYFARIHDIVCRTKLSVSAAARRVAKDHGKTKKVLEKKYREYLQHLSFYLTDEEINEAVSQSLS